MALKSGYVGIKKNFVGKDGKPIGGGGGGEGLKTYPFSRSVPVNDFVAMVDEIIASSNTAVIVYNGKYYLVSSATHSSSYVRLKCFGYDGDLNIEANSSSPEMGYMITSHNYPSYIIVDLSSIVWVNNVSTFTEPQLANVAVTTDIVLVSNFNSETDNGFTSGKLALISNHSYADSESEFHLENTFKGQMEMFDEGEIKLYDVKIENIANSYTEFKITRTIVS